MAKIILNQDQGIPWSDESMDAVAKLEDFIVDSYGSRDPDLTQLFSPGKEIRIRSSLKLPFLQIDGERIRIKDLPAHIQDVNRHVTKHVLESLHPEHNYYICFDQLDREFDPNDPKYSQRLTGLILAARDISRQAKDADRRLSVVILLRDDIYQNLQFEDKNKLTENNLSRVEWATEGDGLTLKSLMEKRFARVLGNGQPVHWNEVFDETKQMPGRQTKYAHICDRTFLRPRDMIKFCNEILQCLVRHTTEGIGTQFDNWAVTSARQGYSGYLLNELDDEIAKQVPRYREYLDVLRAIGNIQFTYGQFKARWDLSTRLAGVDTRAALEQLYTFSVIGYQKTGGAGGGSKYIWQYLDSRVRMSPDAEVFRVHPGFKEALDLAKGGLSVTSEP